MVNRTEVLLPGRSVSVFILLFTTTTTATRMATRLCILGDHLEVKGNIEQGEKALGSASKAPT